MSKIATNSHLLFLIFFKFQMQFDSNFTSSFFPYLIVEIIAANIEPKKITALVGSCIGMYFVKSTKDPNTKNGIDNIATSKMNFCVNILLKCSSCCFME